MNLTPNFDDEAHRDLSSSALVSDDNKIPFCHGRGSVPDAYKAKTTSVPTHWKVTSSGNYSTVTRPRTPTDYYQPDNIDQDRTPQPITDPTILSVMSNFFDRSSELILEEKSSDMKAKSTESAVNNRSTHLIVSTPASKPVYSPSQHRTSTKIGARHSAPTSQTQQRGVFVHPNFPRAGPQVNRSNVKIKALNYSRNETPVAPMTPKPPVPPQKPKESKDVVKVSEMRRNSSAAKARPSLHSTLTNPFHQNDQPYFNQQDLMAGNRREYHHSATLSAADSLSTHPPGEFYLSGSLLPERTSSTGIAGKNKSRPTPPAAASTILHTALTHLRTLGDLPFVTEMKLVSKPSEKDVFLDDDPYMRRKRQEKLLHGRWEASDMPAVESSEPESEGVGTVKLFIDVGQFLATILEIRSQTATTEPDHTGHLIAYLRMQARKRGLLSDVPSGVDDQHKIRSAILSLIGNRVEVIPIHAVLGDSDNNRTFVEASNINLVDNYSNVMNQANSFSGNGVHHGNHNVYRFPRLDSNNSATYGESMLSRNEKSGSIVVALAHVPFIGSVSAQRDVCSCGKPNCSNYCSRFPSQSFALASNVKVLDASSHSTKIKASLKPSTSSACRVRVAPSKYICSPYSEGNVTSNPWEPSYLDECCAFQVYTLDGFGAQQVAPSQISSRRPTTENASELNAVDIVRTVGRLVIPSAYFVDQYLLASEKLDERQEKVAQQVEPTNEDIRRKYPFGLNGVSTSPTPRTPKPPKKAQEGGQLPREYGGPFDVVLSRDATGNVRPSCGLRGWHWPEFYEQLLLGLQIAIGNRLSSSNY